ncbi:MAG: hypothetical protein HYX77_03720 [Acidobacteria bacterium]|nr:hypothetical protein [Acidobacteriota bacterium]
MTAAAHHHSEIHGASILLAALPRCFVDAHRPRAVRFTCSPASQDSGERNWPPPTQVHGGPGGPMRESELVSIRIIPNEQGHPPGKLADAEVIFEADAGPLSGLKLGGFGAPRRR